MGLTDHHPSAQGLHAASVGEAAAAGVFQVWPLPALLWEQHDVDIWGQDVATVVLAAVACYDDIDVVHVLIVAVIADTSVDGTRCKLYW